VKRGFEYKSIYKCSRVIGEIDRNKLLNYKIKEDMPKNNIIFPFLFDKSLTDYSKFLKNSWDETIDNDKNCFFKLYKLFLVPNIQQNLRNVFIFNHKTPKKLDFHTFSCKTDKCQICKFVFYKNYLYIKNNFCLPLLTNSTCNSSNVIYIIFCIKCKSFYVGQTSRCIKIRIMEHVSRVKSYKNFKINTSEVGFHFGQEDHDIDKDFRFLIFQKEEDYKKRISIETDLINIFIGLKSKIINKDIPSLYNINSLTFS
jgi:hypothetical protein